MARFLVKASEFKNVCKAVNDRQLESLKKEIIEILKKQDEKEFKKAINLFESQEMHYTHLEKSLISGKWIQKAGYGVGTVRIWKGKKYKKIAPGKWARVFEKEGRGTNIAIGKLIAKVQKIDNVEDLMAFVMQNKQRFVDENGVDLPVLDKLRAAVDEKNNGSVGSKGTSKPAETSKQTDYYKDISEVLTKDEKRRINEKVEEYSKENEWSIPAADMKKFVKDWQSALKETDKHAKAEKLYEIYSKLEDANWHDENKKLLAGNFEYFNDKYFKDMYGEEPEEKPAEKEESENKTYWIQDNRGNRLTNEDAKKKIIGQMKYLAELEDMAGKKLNNRTANDIRYYIDYLKDRLNPEDRKEIESEAEKTQNRSDAKKGNKNAYKGRVEDIQLKNGARLTTRDGNNYGFAKVSDDRKTSLFIEVKQDKRDGSFKVDYYTADENGRIKYDAGEEGLETDFEDMKSLEEGLNKFFERNPKSESEKSSKEIKSKTDKTVQKISSVDNFGKVVSFDELQPIASNKSVGENEVQLPYSKDLANEIESLKNCTAPKWEPRDFLKHVYYENGKLITTDARRMKFIEVGELEGIPNGSFVDINTDKSGINIKKIDVDARFPNYSKVIPEDLKQSATLDTKLVKDKIKEMQKDGAIDKKGINLVQLEFRDGKVFIDDTPVGEAKDIKMKYGENWGPANKETNFMAINADYLVNALSGKKSVLQIGERADKAIAINTGSTSNILMPMSGSDKKMDYGQGRQAKKENDEYKANAKQKAQDALNSIVDTQKDSMNNELVQSLINKVNNKEMENHKTIIEHAYKALKDAEKMIEKPTKKWTSSLANNKYGYSLLAAVRINPEFKTALENMAMEYGLIKKSLFDDFIVDVFEADDEEEIEDELYEGETEYNDYSAVQPELFNSTAMKVREAFDRMNC